MELEDYKLDTWDGHSIDITIDLNSIKVLLLKVDLTILTKREGRRNIVAVDSSNNIRWIAQLPKHAIYASYDKLHFRDGRLEALSGSTLCEIHLSDGSIHHERFIK